MKNVLNKNRKEKGITLVALVVTIIVLLILAGVAISLTIGNNGLFSRAENAVEKHEESEAREKLELALANIVYDKNIKPVDDEYIDRELEKEGMAVIGDVVIVNDWQFTIDRSIPKIGISLGKGSQNEEIQIASDVKVRDDYVNATMKLDLTYTEGNIKEIIVNGVSKEVPTPVNGVYSLQDIVTENGTYIVLAKDEDGNYKVAKVEVKDITEDMDIWNRADMESFRDKVNSGRTFEGRTARVMADINLEGSEENQWEPIADYIVNNKLEFKGTFEGNSHTIEGLYINTKGKGIQGLFGANSGTIKDLEVKGCVIANNNLIGGITGWNNGTIKKCWNSVDVQGNSIVGGIVGRNAGEIYESGNDGKVSGNENIGGIVGETDISSITSGCCNKGSVSANAMTAGGIVGYFHTGNIYNCYNLGTIYANTMSGGINGAGGHSGRPTAYTYNCYNAGNVKGNSNVGAITGANNVNGGTSQNINCYTTNATAELLNSGAYSDNVWVNDEQNADGTWKYNNGYPILSWQLP